MFLCALCVFLFVCVITSPLKLILFMWVEVFLCKCVLTWILVEYVLCVCVLCVLCALCVCVWLCGCDHLTFKPHSVYVCVFVCLWVVCV